ncbi:MAG: sugar transferase [Clostridia bacterium]|nr:sugar transferase [Clostridia bacterium]
MLLEEKYKLSEELRTDEITPYYEHLQNRKVSLFVKRAFDLVVSLIILTIFLPVLLIIAIAIKLDSPGTVFYRQERVTTYGRIFRIFKFRTMVSNADKIGTLVTVSNDSRITRVGHFLRKYRLDEIPQLINILTGDMSFVGTRPEVKKYVDRYSEEMYATLLMKAGVTSLASIKYKDEDTLLKSAENADETYVNEILPEKMKYNLEYIRKFSFWYDIKLMFMTFFAVIR